MVTIFGPTGDFFVHGVALSKHCGILELSPFVKDVDDI